MKNLKSKGYAYLLPAVLGATLLLSGCWGEKTLDFRNAEIVHGKIYSNGANSPFSGRVTNMERFKISNLFEGTYPIGETLSTLINANSYSLGDLCDVSVKAGVLQGKGLCKAAKGDHVISEFSFENNVLQGHFKISSGTSEYVIAEANFSNGRLDGKMDLFNPGNGKLIYRTKWKEGKQNGETVQYTLDGKQLIYKVKLIDGKKDGIEETYSPTSNKLIAKVNMVNGIIVGSEKHWSNDGSVLLIDRNWVDGKATGFSKQFDATGAKLLVDLTWKDGKATGFETVGDTGGAAYNEYHLKDGLFDGVHKGYAFTRDAKPSGTFLYIVNNYKEGKLNGKSQEFGEDGKISSETYYSEGVEIPLPPSHVAGLDTQVNTTTLNSGSCVDSWTAAHRKEVGEDAMITADQINEWEHWCRQGKLPKAH